MQKAEELDSINKINVIILGKLSSSQSSEVMSGGGISKALMAGGHGYADSYVLEIKKCKKD